MKIGTHHQVLQIQIDAYHIQEEQVGLAILMVAQAITGYAEEKGERIDGLDLRTTTNG